MQSNWHESRSENNRNNNNHNIMPVDFKSPQRREREDSKDETKNPREVHSYINDLKERNCYRISLQSNCTHPIEHCARNLENIYHQEFCIIQSRYKKNSKFLKNKVQNFNNLWNIGFREFVQIYTFWSFQEVHK